MENCQTDLMDTTGPDQDLISKARNEIMSLAEDSAQNEVLGYKCFICDIQLTTKSSISVFYTMLPKSGVLSSNALNKVLKTSYVAPESMRSPVVCNDCFNVLDVLEVAEEQCRSLRSSLVSNFTKTCAMYNQLVDHEYGVACQTDDAFLDNINTSFCDTSEDDTPLSQLTVQIKQEDSVASSKPTKVKKLKIKVKKKKKRDTKAERNFDNTKETVTDQSECENKYSVDHDDDDDSDEPTTHIDLTPTNVKIEPDIVLTEPKKLKRKKFKCTYHDCNRLFRRPGEVKNHILVFHLGKNPNQCTECNKTFNSRNGLYVHLKRAHQMEYSERKELVSKDYDVEIDEKLLSTSYEEEKPIHTEEGMEEEENQNEEEEGDKEDNGSDFEWVEETAEPLPQKRSTRSSASAGLDKKSRRRSRSNSQRRKEKENVGSNQDNSTSRSPRKKIVKVKCLDDDKICDEVMVKEEEVEGEERGEEEDNYEEGDEGERDKEEEEGETTDGERKKRSPRSSRGSRAGERIMMPLIHACDQCGKKWRTVSELNAHIKTHSDLRPFVCEICGQGYKLKKALDVHVGMHKGINPFKCHFCNKSFTQKVGLQKHIPIHTGYSRFQCDLCGKRFIHQKSFQIHKMVHSGEKNIKCNICGLAVLSSSHLTRHYRVHTGERPYQCTTCGKRFAEKYNLNAHQKVHQPPGADGQKEGTPRKRATSHKCTLCRFTTTKKTSLQSHWESEHKHQMNENPSTNYTESPRDVIPGTVIPQMTIDPSGSLTYEEKPLVNENAQSDSGVRLVSQLEPKFEVPRLADPTSDVGYRDRLLPGLSSYEQRTIPIITEVSSRNAWQHLMSQTKSGSAGHGPYVFGGVGLHE